VAHLYGYGIPDVRWVRRLGGSGQANQRVFGEINRERFLALYIFFSAKGFSSPPRFNLPGTLYTRESIGRVKAARVSRQTDLLWLVSSWYFVFLQQTAATSQLRVLDTYINRDVRRQNRRWCKKTNNSFQIRSIHFRTLINPSCVLANPPMKL